MTGTVLYALVDLSYMMLIISVSTKDCYFSDFLGKEIEV